jgi:hypothetical protein
LVELDARQGFSVDIVDRDQTVYQGLCKKLSQETFGGNLRSGETPRRPGTPQPACSWHWRRRDQVAIIRAKTADCCGI